MDDDKGADKSRNSKTEPKKISKRRKKHPSFIKNLSYYFGEYCQNTSLHGLKFLGEQGRSIIERFWWVAALTISLFACMYLITKTYQKWQRSPVIVNFATSQTPIWQIPFPAITICPETKTDQKMFNYTEIHRKKTNNLKLSTNETRYYEYMALLCMNNETLSTEYLINERLLDFMTKVAPTVENSLWRCKWMSVETPCSTLMTPIITEVGVCFTFNILDRTEMFSDDVYRYKNYQSTNLSSGWSPIDGYSEDDDIDSYPQRALFSTAKAGLSMTLETKVVDIDHLCSGGMQGYKVHVHHPADTPSIDENFFRISLNQSVSVAVKPIMMTTNEKLYSYSPEKRQCYFPEEKALRFFKMYNQQNCQVECLTNFTFHSCGCVAFYMPRTKLTPVCGPAKKRCVINAEVCGPAKKRCVINAEGQFLTGQVSKKIRQFADDIPENDFSTDDTCDCLPACFSTSYDVEITQTPWNWEKFYDCEEFRQKIKDRPNSGVRTYHSRLVVYFKERQIMTSQRNELYGYTDFIANCGGLLGLFIGFSVISFTELVYFLTLRFVCNLRKFGRHFWSGNQELLDQKQEDPVNTSV